MKKILLIAILSLTTMLSTGCTDRFIGKVSAYGGSATIKCYSGTLLIYEGISTGKISSEANSDGYSFISKKTNKLTEVSGNCVIEYTEY